MFKVIFYKDRNGREPLKEYLAELATRTDKNSRINFQKIREYTAYLSEHGKQSKEPYVKHLDGEIWELRPIRARVLFAAWDGNKFILLHHFTKKTQKTPQREIDQAKQNLADYRERSKDNESK
jgi:phage-related protein